AAFQAGGAKWWCTSPRYGLPTAMPEAGTADRQPDISALTPTAAAREPTNSRRRSRVALIVPAIFPIGSGCRAGTETRFLPEVVDLDVVQRSPRDYVEAAARRSSGLPSLRLDAVEREVEELQALEVSGRRSRRILRAKWTVEDERHLALGHAAVAPQAMTGQPR